MPNVLQTKIMNMVDEDTDLGVITTALYVVIKDEATQSVSSYFIILFAGSRHIPSSNPDDSFPLISALMYKAYSLTGF